MTKTVVEDCLILDINNLLRRGFLQSKPFWQTSLRWNDGSNVEISGEPYSSSASSRLITLIYLKNGEELRYYVPVLITYSKVGVRFFWFQCPIVLNGQPCMRKVRKLYLPYYAKYFGCRHCHDLSYISRQDWSSR